MQFLLKFILINLFFSTISTQQLFYALENRKGNQNNMIEASYGTWKSPITAEKIAAGINSTINLLLDGENSYLCESRPSNKGRFTLVKRDLSGKMTDVTSPDFNVKTYVHEYGGGAFTVSNGVVYASNATDSKIYQIKPNMSPRPLTEGQTKISENGNSKHQGTRFADLHVSSYGLVAVGEHHESNQEAENFLALIDTNTGQYKKITSGYDFYSSPTISEDNTKIAWVCWNHPEMPWSNTELWVADFIEGKIANPKKVAGDIPEAIQQPLWSKDGSLYFISDRDTGWWNLHRYSNEKIENICPMEAEIGEPLWNFERSSYTFLGEKIIFGYNKDGITKLAIIDPTSKMLEKLDREGATAHQFRSGPGYVQFLRGYPDQGEALIQIDDAPGYPETILFQQQMLANKEYISIPQHISFNSNGRTAYGFYLPPKNRDYTAPSNEMPPLVVMIHGGPTAQSKGALTWTRQYWTSQGFAVLDVNYGGSTGYGRTYRNILNLNWGIIDVEDCVNGALYVSEKGLADRNKLVIRGGSAGGYTTLAALAFHNTFKAGASYYGVADITALADDTHKFESRYMEHLVGKYPEEKEIWEKRSPINSVDKIQSPLILFQGEEDAIVPKNQSEMIFEALNKKGLPVELHIYPEEEHGFRQAQNIIHSMNREADFYREVFNLGKKKY